jgi:hypothetical protein
LEMYIIRLKSRRPKRDAYVSLGVGALDIG